MPKFNRIHLVVLDSVGIGAAPDAHNFVNAGVPDGASDTLGHISKSVGLNVPNMAKIGLGNIPRETPLKTVPAESNPTGYATKLEEVSLGEANKPYSGTAVIDDFGPRQMETGELIIYTSADPVLQIAAHEDIIPLDELYRICEYARSITLERPALLGRIIARPYVGEPGNFTRTANRRDLAVSPFAPTVLDKLNEAGIDTYAVGKINDIFNGAGINNDLGHNKSNSHGIDNLIKAMKSEDFKEGFSFTNLVDFDALYGHRRDPHGYRDCLHEFDERLPEIIAAMREDDLLLITADHGNDPTYAGTDHTREYIPLLAYSPAFKGSGLLPVGHFSDISATIADNFGVETAMIGESFLDKLV